MADLTDPATAGGTTERRSDKEQDWPEFVRFWLERIELARKAEEKWRERAERNVKRYANEEKVHVTGTSTTSTTADGRRKFNIFYTNVETIVPAIYNSTPAPDVRRRFGDMDPPAKMVAQVLERCITVALDQFPADDVFRGCEKDNEITGRGLPRLRYEDDPTTGAQRVWLEVVDWRDFVRGPAKVWGELPFIAFRDYLTREQLEKLSPEFGPLVAMDATEDGAAKKDQERRDGKNMGDALKRASVWQIWDKERRQMLSIAPGYKEAPLTITADPLELIDFYPVPAPLYAIMRAHSLEPIDPLRQYEDQANELDDITQRLGKLVKVARWRGVANAGMAGAFSQLKDALDGEIVPSSNAQEFREGEIDKSIWMMPVDKLMTLIMELYKAREEVKRTIFEITGVADIMRGDTVASETATAQRIKAQWGSLRIQQRQADMMRLCRDSMRLMAEIISSKFTPQTMKAMSGIDLAPLQVDPAVIQQVQAMAAQGMGMPPEIQKMIDDEKVKAEALAILKSDVMRTYRIDVETDSTIRADLSRAQENIGTFITGMGQFFTAVAPAVQAGAMPMPIAIKLLTSFARNFKLGRQAEDALDQWATLAENNPALGVAPPVLPSVPPGGQPQPGQPQPQPPQGPPMPQPQQTGGQPVSPMPPMVQ